MTLQMHLQQISCACNQILCFKLNILSLLNSLFCELDQSFTMHQDQYFLDFFKFRVWEVTFVPRGRSQFTMGPTTLCHITRYKVDTENIWLL